MSIPGLVFGLLDTSRDIADAEVAARARELSIAWSRFKYFDVILESESIDGLLDQALERGARYCLIQAHGHILSEIWHPESTESVDVMAALADWIEREEFFVTGHVTHSADQWYGLDRRCLLVDLDRYREFGQPAFDPPCAEAIDLNRGHPIFDGDDEIERLDPIAETVSVRPRLPGWNFIQASLAGGRPVAGFPPSIAAGMLYLAPDDPVRASTLRRYLVDGIENFGNRADSGLASAKEEHFFDNIQTLTQNLRRGVFVWNLESYADVERPPDEFSPPLQSLYTVSAGFKPNRILHTHGFDDRTRMVVFDYSQQGLKFRRLLHETWDGEDYPEFLRGLFEKRPSGEAFYLLWDNVTPETVNWDDIESRWRQELDAWGGATVLRDHWRRFRRLRVGYVLCNLLTDPAPLFAQIQDEPNAVIWWSNAFFSVYSNWFYTARQRRDIYQGWIDALAKRAPRLFLYGSDCNNISVNFVQAEPYRQWYRQTSNSELEPRKRHRHELRF